MFYSCIAMMDGITVALLSHISTLHIQLYSAQRDSATPEFLSIRAKTQSGRAASSCRSQSERNQATLLEAVRRAKEVVSKPIARQIHAKLTASGIALMLSAVKWSCSAVHQSQLWQQPSRVERDEDGGSACSCAIVTPAADVPDLWYMSRSPEQLQLRSTGTAQTGKWHGPSQLACPPAPKGAVRCVAGVDRPRRPGAQALAPRRNHVSMNVVTC